MSERKIRFTSNHSAKDLLARIEDTVTEMGFRVQKKNGKVSFVTDEISSSNMIPLHFKFVISIIILTPKSICCFVLVESNTRTQRSEMFGQSFSSGRGNFL